MLSLLFGMNETYKKQHRGSELIHTLVLSFALSAVLLGKVEPVDDGRQQSQNQWHDPRLEGVFVLLLGAPVGFLLDRDLLPLGLDQLADLELLHHLARVRAVADVLERLGRFLASLLQQDLLTAGVLVQELRHVVDIIVNHNPGGLVRVVGLNLGQRVGFHFRRHSGGDSALYFGSGTAIRGMTGTKLVVAANGTFCCLVGPSFL